MTDGERVRLRDKNKVTVLQKRPFHLIPRKSRHASSLYPDFEIEIDTNKIGTAPIVDSVPMNASEIEVPQQEAQPLSAPEQLFSTVEQPMPPASQRFAPT